MPCTTTDVLVVANLTAASPELVETLVARGQHDPAAFTLLVPASSDAGGWDAARDRLDEALTDLRAEGLDVKGRIGCGDPVLAVFDEWDPTRYGELILSTLPPRASDWVDAEVPERVERLTAARVTHIVSELTMLTAEPRPHFEERVPTPRYGLMARQTAPSSAAHP
jgi:hypothetical protein